MTFPCDQCDRLLIVDVGMNDGSDTAYYLHCGYRVVAVEANPKLTSLAERRFHRHIANGQLTVLNVGIADREGTSDFWIAATNDQWSSFSKPIATRRGTTVCEEPVRVHCLPLSAVLAEFGKPFYLKMDIEGYDVIGLESLSRDLAPQSISVEFAHGTEMELLERLLGLGYCRFKLLNQVTYTDHPPIFEDELPYRAVRKLYALAPPLRPVIRNVVHKSDFDTFQNTRHWRFPEGSSGPFGEQTYGDWMTSDEVLRRYSKLHRKFQKAGA